MLLTKRTTIYFIPAAILILVVVILLNRQNGAEGEDPEVVQPGKTSPAVQSNGGEDPAANANDGQKAEGIPSGEKKLTAKEQSLKTLQSLMDDEETHGEAMKLALTLAETGDAEQKVAAIETFNWIGGHESKMALTNLLTVGGLVSENATAALQHLFLEDAQDSEKPFDEEAFSAAILQLSGASRDALFIILGGYPVETAAPILIKLMDSKDESLRELVFETFSSMAEGEEISTREAAEKWLAKYRTDNKAE